MALEGVRNQFLFEISGLEGVGDESTTMSRQFQS